jgi:glutathione peroxidase
MKNLILIAIIILAVFFLLSFFSKKDKPISSIHQFKVKDINGNIFDFSSLKGKKILIVNTASKCGFTPQYKEMEELYEIYKNSNFTIIGFPCNQFGEQEPGSSDEIKNFCQKNYGVSFPMMEKTNVKGDSISELYKWLTTKSLNGVMNSSVRWNFQKYLIDENGFLVDYYLPFKSPKSSKIIKWIEKQPI